MRKGHINTSKNYKFPQNSQKKYLTLQKYLTITENNECALFAYAIDRSFKRHRFGEMKVEIQKCHTLVLDVKMDITTLENNFIKVQQKTILFSLSCSKKRYEVLCLRQLKRDIKYNGLDKTNINFLPKSLKICSGQQVVNSNS